MVQIIVILTVIFLEGQQSRMDNSLVDVYIQNAADIIHRVLAAMINAARILFGHAHCQFTLFGGSGKLINILKASLKKLEQNEKKYASELDAALTQYTELKWQAADVNPVELESARQAIRPDKEREMFQHLQTAYQKKFDFRMLAQSRKDIAEMLDETAEPVSIC